MCLVSIAYWRRGTSVRQYSHRVTIRCALPIFKPIAYKLNFTNRKRKYFEEKTTATLKIKQTSIATVRNHILTVACLPTPLPFHYPLPLRIIFLSFKRRLTHCDFLWKEEEEIFAKIVLDPIWQISRCQNNCIRALPVSICPSSPSSSIRAAPTATSQLASPTHAASLRPTATIFSGQQYLTTDASMQPLRRQEPLVLLSFLDSWASCPLEPLRPLGPLVLLSHLASWAS